MITRLSRSCVSL